MPQYHPEKNLTSAIERYANEVHRVLSVIELQLSKTEKPYLVGDKASFADLMFLTWNQVALEGVMGADFDKEWQQKYPKSWEWHQRLMSREAVRTAFAKKAEVNKGQKH